MEKKQLIAIGIALQTQVLKTCPVHRQLYFDDDVNPAGAFALAIDLVRKRKPYVDAFHDEHELTDLLSDTLGTTPIGCPECQSSVRSNSLPSVRSNSLPSVRSNSLPDRGRFSEGALEGRQIVGFGQHQNSAQSLSQQKLDVEGAVP
jgi:hypothetical protein